MREWIAVLGALLIALAVAPADRSEADAAGDSFIVISITPFGQATFDVKLKNPRTGYVHSVTVTIDIARLIHIGDRVEQRYDRGRVILTPIGGGTGESPPPRSGPEQPSNPREPNPDEANWFLRQPKLPMRGMRGEPVRYFIQRLGAEDVVAWAEVNGRRLSLSDSVRERSRGVDRPFRPWENAFDTVTDNRWNWTGSHTGGGRRDIRHGGIGDVDVECLNDFDCLAKNHDIQFWLEANFQVGSNVNVRMNGIFHPFVVQSFNALNQQASRDFPRVATRVLDAAGREARVQHDADEVQRIGGLRQRLAWNDPTVLRAIFDDRRLWRFVGAPRVWP